MKFGLITTFIIILSFHNILFAQPGNGERPTIGILTGQVVESESKKPIPYSKIFLLNVRDSSLATGGLSDSLGNFNIDLIPVGPYIVKIISFGFEPLFIDSLFFSPKAPQINLGTVYMVPDANQLTEVDIVYEEQEVVAQ